MGYSTVKFFLNDEVFISLEGHKANKIGEDIIVYLGADIAEQARYQQQGSYEKDRLWVVGDEF